MIPDLHSSPPQLSSGSNQVVECGTAWSFAAPSAFDICDGTNVVVTILSTTTNRVGFCGTTFSATRTWRATDQCTNASTCSQMITVIDTTPPQLTCGSNQEVACCTAWSFAAPSAFDICDTTNAISSILCTCTNRASFCCTTISGTR